MRQKSECVLPISSRLVWMTCGQEAGYQVLLAPPATARDWTSLLEQAFPNFEIGRTRLRTERLTINERPALAAAFFDPSYCDSSSRPIKHFMIFLDIHESLIEKAQRLNIPELLSQLNEAFTVIYQASRHTPEPLIMQAAEQKVAHSTLRLSFTAKAIAKIDSNGKQIEEKPEALVMPKLIIWLLVLVVGVAVAVALFFLHPQTM